MEGREQVLEALNLSLCLVLPQSGSVLLARDLTFESVHSLLAERGVVMTLQAIG